ncbi:hypothetical protein FH972_000796 [Carpinus fangiana]|uniref:Uncharacterized protein n=1 Tax=Carpinus fangiana TaxID=176857 RepID=A0A5N6Q9Y8_9ROSI|nr:hypothetical protein FH972_000796 [Carpinus fangiana]
MAIRERSCSIVLRGSAAGCGGNRYCLILWRRMKVTVDGICRADGVRCDGDDGKMKDTAMWI